jgi:hypothetical protein
MDLKQTVDNVGELLTRVATLTTSDVLVGIPAAKAARKDGKISNAALGYVHEFGSPAHNLPARPFLHPGVRKVRAQAIAMLKQGAIDALNGKGNVTATLNRVGMLARNSVVNEITDPEPPFAPLKASTIRARLRRTAAGRRQLRKLKGKSVTAWAEATDPDTGSLNIHPLIDTGALRASLTYVVRRL